MAKKIKYISRVLIIALLSVVAFLPFIESKAASYNYDFWKNIVPSAEGLAYSKTYYNEDIVGSGDEKIYFSNNLADLAVSGNDIYILDSTLSNDPTGSVASVVISEAKTYNGISYPELTKANISVVYHLNSNFEKVETLSEFRINDAVKKTLQDYYKFYLENYQIMPEHVSSENYVTTYNDPVEYTYTLPFEENEIIIKEFVYGTYSIDSKTYQYTDTTLELSDDTGKVIDSSLWHWEVNEIVDAPVLDENGSPVPNQTEKKVDSYKIVFDDSLVSNVSRTIKASLRTAVEESRGKAPYYPYSEDPTQSAIRLNGASGITVVGKYMYIADTNNSQIIRYDLTNKVVDGIYLTPNDTTFYQPAVGAVNNDLLIFKPQKVAVDKTGRLYCIAQNIYEGIMEFHTSGSFNRFLGKNEVVANPLKKFWSKIFSETQIASLKLDLPNVFTNIAMDESGFLYATSVPDADATTNANLVKMINTTGTDILKRNGYVTPDGDAVYLLSSTEKGVITGMSQLTGITVSKNGNYTVVDENRGRLFTYDNEGNLLYITGEQPGGQTTSSATSSTIVKPVAVRYFYRDSGEVDENNNPIEEEVLLVLDKTSKSIISYETTEFGEAVNTATTLYQNGIVQDEYLKDEKGNFVLDENGEKIIETYGSEYYWRKVIKMDTNYELAYLGIGKALNMRGEYKEAMEYFKLAHNATYYSKAYSEYRDAILSNNFSWIMCAVILAVVALITFSYAKSLKRKNLAIAKATALNEEKAAILSGNIAALKRQEKPEVEEENDEENDSNDKPKEKKITFNKIIKAIKHFFSETIGFPLYILSHPIQGFNDFKVEKKGKMWVSIVILLAYVLMEILAFQFEGIIVNTNNPKDFNSIQILIYGVVPPFVLAVANWSVTTLLDGKGKFKEIFMMICYSLLPVTLLGFLNIILSNVMTQDEAQFISLIKIISWVLTGYMAFMGLVVIHEYGMGKTIWSIILTVVATLIIAFIALLIFDLAQQMYGFIYSLYKEITIRFF